MNETLRQIALAISSPVEARLFGEYGAIFATRAVPPPVIVFKDAEQVQAFQQSLRTDRTMVGEHEMTLQVDALAALMSAKTRMFERGGLISARSGDAGARSYEETVALWVRNVNRGLDHWISLGRISTERARSISSLDPVEQVAPILELEEAEHLFCGTFFDRSILHSVAAPGASQHLSLLAFDVLEYEDETVESELARSGWYRTVPNDLPHFTYLGHAQEELPGVGLKRVTRTFGGHVYGFWIPDLDRLQSGGDVGG